MTSTCTAGREFVIHLTEVRGEWLLIVTVDGTPLRPVQLKAPLDLLHQAEGQIKSLERYAEARWNEDNRRKLLEKQKSIGNQLADYLFHSGTERGDNPLPKLFEDWLRHAGKEHFARIVLAIDDRRLLSLPWELTRLKHENVPVCIGIHKRFAVSRAAPPEQRGPTETSDRPLDVFAAATADDEGLREAWRSMQEDIRKALGGPIGANRARLAFGEPARLGDELMWRRPKPSVLHLFGHGGNPDGGYSLEAFFNAGATDLSVLAHIAELPSPYLVFWMSCYGAGLGLDAGKWMYTVAADRMLSVGIPNVLTTRGPLTLAQESLRCFTTALYKALGMGCPIDYAAQQARRALWILQHTKKIDPEEWTPLLPCRMVLLTRSPCALGAMQGAGSLAA